MAWATGVSFNGLTWEAHFLEPDGTTSVGPLTRLASDGVAVESGRCRQQIDTDFGTWERVPAADYREALGIASQPDKAVNDVVFQIRHSRGRIVIPALVLIRAFFRPGREFIPEVFRHRTLRMEQLSPRQRIRRFKGAAPLVVLLSLGLRDDSFCFRICKAGNHWP